MMFRIVVSLAAILAAGTAHALDLMDIYRLAQINDTRYAAAKAQYLATQERLPQARAGLLPDVGFEAGYNYNDIDVEYDSAAFNSGRRDYTAYNYGIRATQPLYRRQNSLTVDQASVLVAQAATDLDLANQDLVIRTAASQAQGALNLSTAKASELIREQRQN